jgi:hypothetical protein
VASVEKPSKGAEKILLAQIKQEFSAPAEAIEQYIDLVEQFAVQNNLEISSEINQIKEAEDKLLSQYEDAFRENTASDNEAKTSQ